MPWFTPQGLASTARHRLLGLGRIVLGRKRDHYIEAMRQRGVVLHPVTERSRHYVDCPLCGYALASFAANPDWIVETCSAYLLPNMLSSPSFPKYMNRLPKPNSPSEQAGDLSRSVAVPAAPSSD